MSGYAVGDFLVSFTCIECTQVNHMSRSRRVLAIGGKHYDHGWTGLYLSINISYKKFLPDQSSKQVASVLNDEGSW